MTVLEGNVHVAVQEHVLRVNADPNQIEQVLMPASRTGGTETTDRAAPFRQQIDLLCTDAMMPGLNGFEVADQLRRLQRQSTVVFVSGGPGN